MSELLAQHHATSACSAEGEAVEAHSLLATGGPPIRQQVRQGLPEDADPTPQGTVMLSQATSVECVSSGVVHEYASVNAAARAHGIARGTIFRMIRDGVPRRGLLVRQVTRADRPARTPTVHIERVPSGEVFEYASERAAAPNRSSIDRCKNTSVSPILTNPYPLRSLYQTSSPSLTLISVTFKILKQSLTPCFGIELKIAEDGDG